MTSDAINAVAERGREIYETQIRPYVEADHHGEFLMINTMTGEYEMAPDEATVTVNALKRFGPGIHFLTVRIGYRAVARLGGGKLV
ncbi:MAG: hypothetical protein H7145_17370 [Akkermansiaceae bacterium]|nr:hypothetical protein [Armatimonadota bacterium]